VRARRWIALLWLLLMAWPAQAQQLTLTTEVDYLLVEQGFRDPEEHVATSGFFPKVNLAIAGRLFPTSRLFLDLSGGLTQDTFGASDQSTNDVRVVLRTEAPRYRLALRHGRSSHSSSTQDLGLGTVGLTTDSRQTDVTLLLRQPSWPTLNLQYARYTSDSSLGGPASHSESTDSRIGLAYDLAPLHFRFDQNHRAGGTEGSERFAFDGRRAAVSLDTALFPKLNLYGDLQLYHSEVSSGDSAATGTDFQVGSLRLSTELTPKVALDGQLFSQVTRRFPESNTLSARGASVSMRSEVVPNVQLNLTGNLLHSEFAGRSTDSTNASLELLARVDPRNSLAFTYSPNHASFSDAPGVDQTACRLSWTSLLTSRLELTASFDHFDDTSADFSGRTDSRYLALRYRPDLQTTLGLSLLSDRASTSGPGGEISQEARSVTAEFSWLPTGSVSLGCHLGLSRFQGEAETQVTAPAFDLRWQPDSRSDLSVSWRMQTEVQRELDLTTRLGFTALATRFSRRLSRGANVNFSYDVVEFEHGPFAYERRLAVSLTTGLGR
jgi:hypothetical protein